MLLFSLGAILVAIRAYLSTGDKAVAGRRYSPPLRHRNRSYVYFLRRWQQSPESGKGLLHGEGDSFGSQSPTGAIAR